ncbi:related to beta-fructofuranosidase [Rhynchosporium graminicola]|uniref:beta-fructofuranosidase n=1 Tax=Rhynchosporium graminicola TaxID=2792576 RepID=A0A1E1JQS4_9HELO|nr:related to beta-fructofuranosidase [Rhynchosporium commune]
MKITTLSTLLSLSLLTPSTHSSIIPRTSSSTTLLSSTCHSSRYDGPLNPDFEVPGLANWTVISGNAFGPSSTTDQTTYWAGSFNQHGKSFLWGLKNAGDEAIGELHSSIFKASNVMSFLVGGGWDPENLYVGLKLVGSEDLLFKQTGMGDDALIRIVWDTSKYAGKDVYLVLVDKSAKTDFGHINIDDVRTGCEALLDDGLHFNVLGQANQPSKEGSLLSVEDLHAVDPIRPQFHYGQYQGWINDPAGLIQWKGKHYLFSQEFNPDAPLWGPMHWSHAESSDAVHWRELPVALYPIPITNALDSSGRFTGSAVVDNSTGGLHIIYTEFTNTDTHPGAAPEAVSSVTSLDGTTFSYSPKNPIIKGPPPTGSSNGFRDPKVFWDTNDQTWKFVIGSGEGAKGRVQLYVAQDASLLEWEFVSVVAEGDGTTGGMWECPNMFPLGDKWVLFYGGRSLGFYEVGTYNGTKFVPEKTGLLDAGPHSYAMQWYIDEAGRNLGITWLGNWDSNKWPSRVNGWAGTQSITREFFLREDGGLGTRPIAEVASLASGPTTSMGKIDVHGTIKVGSTNTARLQLSVDLKSSNAPAFTVFLYQSKAEAVVLKYTFGTKTLSLDTTKAGYGQAGVWSAVIAPTKDGVLSLDVLIDRSSVEIFAGDGTAMTATVFSRFQESTDIKIEAVGGKAVFASIDLTPFGSSWKA